VHEAEGERDQPAAMDVQEPPLRGRPERLRPARG
jgi:hypothetical protein